MEIKYEIDTELQKVLEACISEISGKKLLKIPYWRTGILIHFFNREVVLPLEVKQNHGPRKVSFTERVPLFRECFTSKMLEH